MIIYLIYCTTTLHNDKYNGQCRGNSPRAPSLLTFNPHLALQAAEAAAEIKRKLEKKEKKKKKKERKRLEALATAEGEEESEAKPEEENAEVGSVCARRRRAWSETATVKLETIGIILQKGIHSHKTNVPSLTVL